MSRIGKLPIAVPSGVMVSIDSSVVTVKGPKGELSHTVAAPITVEQGEGDLVFQQQLQRLGARARREQRHRFVFQQRFQRQKILRQIVDQQAVQSGLFG